MKREIKFQIIYANKIDGYERLIAKDGHIFWQWMCLEMNPPNLEKWISGVYPKQYKYIRRQFTGLTDKNGKEIYEGDIMKLIDEYSGKGERPSYVIFKDSQWMMQGTMHYTHVDSINNYCLDKMKIIGNIYENPELLTND